MENKELITELLEATINATRIGHDGDITLTYIVTNSGEELIKIKAYGHIEYVDVTSDNGCALIRRIIRSEWLD